MSTDEDKAEQIIVRWHLPDVTREYPKDVVLVSIGTFTANSLYVMYGDKALHLSAGARVLELKEAFHKELKYEIQLVKPNDYCCYTLPDWYPLKMLTGLMLFSSGNNPIHITLRHDHDNVCELFMLLCNGDCIFPCCPPVTGVCYMPVATGKRLTWIKEHPPEAQVMN